MIIRAAQDKCTIHEIPSVVKRSAPYILPVAHALKGRIVGWIRNLGNREGIDSDSRVTHIRYIGPDPEQAIHGLFMHDAPSAHGGPGIPDIRYFQTTGDIEWCAYPGNCKGKGAFRHYTRIYNTV